MAIANSMDPTQRKPLRLWPGVVILIVQWLMRFVFPIIFPDKVFIGVLGSIACGILILLWWLFFSRAAWSERLIALVLIPLILFGFSFIVHESISKGAMGMLYYILSIPFVSLAFVAWAWFARNMPVGIRRIAMVAAIMIGAAVLMLVRTHGFTADFDNDFAWRWQKTPEEILLERSGGKPKGTATAAVTESPVVWPGFRGANRDGIIRNVQIDTNWSSSPPAEIWRRQIGPGWSSFAVQGDFLFTQEQRGEDEVVACYKLQTGEPVWQHVDRARFWESNGGAGPRSTPTLSNGRVYTVGGTGILNVLNATDGSVVWSRNIGTDTKVEVPYWGFSSSPLIMDDLVIVAAAAKLAAYDLETGNPRWYGSTDGAGYSSPHLLTIDGVPQIVLLSDDGVVSAAPSDGKLLWKHTWKGNRIVQPAMTAEGDVLVGDGAGIGRLTVKNGSGGWSVQERWKSIRLKPYFNDFVVHNGYAYGLDGGYATCINLQDGERKWKGGKYGGGQLVLLADQGLLIILSERGEVALVSASPDKFTEFGRYTAIKGKTWNHPVVAGDILLVRNGEEMAAYRLSLKHS